MQSITATDITDFLHSWGRRHRHRRHQQGATKLFPTMAAFDEIGANLP